MSSLCIPPSSINGQLRLGKRLGDPGRLTPFTRRVSASARLLAFANTPPIRDYAQQYLAAGRNPCADTFGRY